MKKIISLLTSSALLTTMSAAVVSAEDEENGTDYKLVCTQTYGAVYDITAENPDGTTYNPAENKNDTIPENVTYITNATKVTVDEWALYEDYRNKLYSTVFETNDKKVDIENAFPGQVVIDDNEVTLKNLSSNPIDGTSYLFDLMQKDTDYTSTKYKNIQWSFSGKIEYDDEVKVSFVDDGFILKRSPGNSSESSICVNKIIPNGTTDEGITIADDYINLTTVDFSGESLMVTVDENDNVTFSIDPDKDGTYQPAEKGDANFDGKTDASDASVILGIYAETSTSTVSNYNYIADYNGDGVIDATDASDVLNRYSELATK